MAATAKADMTPDHWVTAPACWLMEERVSEPEPGMHWKNEPERLARPSERHCWLMSIFWRVWAAMALAMAMASSRPRVAMARALVESWRR